MFLKWITSYLLFLTFIHLPHTGAENVFSAVEGETVYLPCHSPPNECDQVSIEWIKHSTNNMTICTWNINKKTEHVTGNCIPRFKFNRTFFSLSIENIQPSDSGKYSCKTLRIIPPPSLENITNVTLQVEVRPHLFLQLLNSGNDTCVHILCSMEGLTPEKVNFTWSREDQRSLHQFTSNSTNSELRLCKPDWSEGDNITCYAKYADTQTQKSILLPSQKNLDHKTSHLEHLLIISCSAAAGLILCTILPVVICKCRKRDEHGSIVFSNKVYENFSFAMARQNTQHIDKPQPEECIYEN